MNARFVLLAALVVSSVALVPSAAANTCILCNPPPPPPLPCASVNCIIADAVALANGAKATALCLEHYAIGLSTYDWLNFDPLHDRLPSQSCIILNPA
jgi:hypothetical protein